MPITKVFWSDGAAFDVHLLPNQSTPALDQLLAVKYSIGATNHSKFAQAARADGIDTTFEIEIQGLPPRFGLSSFDSTTGIVIAGATPFPARRVFNFLIRAKVTDNTGVAPIPFTDSEPRIRVHLHASITRAWFTPSNAVSAAGAVSLTIRRDDHPVATPLPAPRLTLLAEFDDQSVGDITEMAGIVWTSRNPTDLAVNPATGELRGLTAGTNTGVGVNLPAPFGAVAVADATVRCEPPWSTALPAELISGSPSTGKPGAPLVTDIPNFLFIADGFTAGQRKQFEKLVQAFVDFLRTHDGAQPYGMVSKTAINYWQLFLESPETGGTALYEMRPIVRGPKTLWTDVPPPITPAVGATIWSLMELVDRVGLPVRADAAIAMATKVADWQAIYSPTANTHVNAALYAQWQALAERRILNERNTALGMACGIRPNVQQMISSVPRAPRFHRFRAQREHLDDMLKALTNGIGGATLPAVWPTGGKDSALVIIICGGMRDSGAAGDEIKVGVVVESEYEATAVGATRALDPVPFALPNPKSLSVDAKTTVAHEGGHVLGLGDEYGEFVALTAPNTVAPDILKKANIQHASTVRVGGKLDGSLVRWRWHRITAAGVLTSQPVPVGAKFRLPLMPKHGKRFKVGDTVRLRTRPLAAVTAPSDGFDVDVVAADEITISLPAGTTLVPASFPAGGALPRDQWSIVFVPKRGKVQPPALAGPELLVMHADIEAHITAHGNPLNAAPPPVPPLPAPPHVCTVLPRGLTNPSNLPETLRTGKRKKPSHPSWMVGIYDGGHRYHCDAYHPAGICMMRQQEVAPGVTPTKGTTTVFAFCAVCQYIIVDKLDPTRHGALDARYEKRYPETK